MTWHPRRCPWFQQAVAAEAERAFQAEVKRDREREEKRRKWAEWFLKVETAARVLQEARKKGAK